MVITKTSKYVIVPMKEADKRLEASEYYKNRKDSWFDDAECYCNLIPDGELDIEMTIKTRSMKHADGRRKVPRNPMASYLL